MTQTQHKLYVSFFLIVTILVLALLIINGYAYYTTPLEEKFFSESHNILKPSGILGHGFGILGSFLMITGVVIYMVRKRIKRFARSGALKYWLELHIFLCTIGPILILFHTSFKFGGIVSVSFWSMVAVFVSGIIGRFIYIRIPHTIDGNEMNMQQINNLNTDLTIKLINDYNLDNATIDKIDNLTKVLHQGRASLNELIITFIPKYLENRKKISLVSKELKENNISKYNRKQIIKIVKEKISISNKIYYLRLMQSIFKYWHVAHLPFAIIMLIIMFVHIAVTITFGYRWIF